MKSCWLHQSGAAETIVFMAGWGMGPEPFKGLASGGVDVLMFYDFRSLDDCDISRLLPGPGTGLHLLAWSMGVWVAARVLEKVSFRSATALGGTLHPVDDRQGIPTRVFAGTINDFSDQVLEEFYQAMFENEEESARFLARRPQRPLGELRSELVNLHAACTNQPVPADIYSLRLVTGRDRIFPARNQVRAWGRERCIVKPLPHFPWYGPGSWANLLDSLQP